MAKEAQPKQGLSIRNGEPVFSIVFTPADVAGAAGVTEEKAADLIRTFADRFVDGFLAGGEWEQVLSDIVDCLPKL